VGLALMNSTLTFTPAPMSVRANAAPAASTDSSTSWSQLSASRKLMKPGPAISTAFTWRGRWALRWSASCSPRSRGLRPAALALASATFEDQSPCSRLAGRSRLMEAGSGSTPSAPRASRSAEVRVSVIMLGPAGGGASAQWYGHGPAVTGLFGGSARGVSTRSHPNRDSQRRAPRPLPPGTCRCRRRR
jgi:hypothetical protein